ncbi:MAG: hypothetical protein M2R45_00628 [Verrucomicrobia subdivision 3 bacterium]|nr:hypothetical protein [Limisphaerales bacterium]MCS1414489.1 hypothetical protein [Limisphaerales bacterium]
MIATLLITFESVVRMSFGASVLIMGNPLPLYWLLRKWLPVAVFYGLSILVLLRLVVPVFPQSDYSFTAMASQVDGIFLCGSCHASHR